MAPFREPMMTAGRSRRRFLASVAAGAMLAWRRTVAADTVLLLPDANGGLVDPFTTRPDCKATVFVFVSATCPISNRYAPLLNRLHASHRRDPMAFWLVYPNPAESPAVVREHLAAFASGIPALRDPDQHLVDVAGATVTPEAAVFDRRRALVYRGRIDDRYVRIGIERPSATAHDLADVLDAMARGRAIGERRTDAVGCFIADFRRRG